MNRRIAKSVDGTVVEKFIYLSKLKPIAKLNSDDSIFETYTYGTKINVPEYVVRNGNTYRIITDHLGSVRLVVDASDGTIKQKMTYDEFGNLTEDYIETGFEPVPFGYAGGLYDRDTKLVTFGVREYDSVTGRWLEKEPLGFIVTDNFYIYSNNDPINRYDSSGFAPRTSYGPDNLDDLIKDIEDYVLHKYPDSLEHEYLAEIYFDGQCYYYTEPYTDGMYDNVTFDVQGSALNVLKEKGMVAYWHSHVAHDDYVGSLSPSPDDIALGEYFGTGYMTYFDSRNNTYDGVVVHPPIKF